MEGQRITPELDVFDLDLSLEFYTAVIGAEVVNRRPEEGFAMLSIQGAELMLQTAGGPGRRFHDIAEMQRPLGRGINLQIEVGEVDAMFARVAASGRRVVIPLEERWYGMADGTEAGNRQFVVADPDGYLLRFFKDMGQRPKAPGP